MPLPLIAHTSPVRNRRGCDLVLEDVPMFDSPDISSDSSDDVEDYSGDSSTITNHHQTNSYYKEHSNAMHVRVVEPEHRGGRGGESAHNVNCFSGSPMYANGNGTSASPDGQGGLASAPSVCCSIRSAVIVHQSKNNIGALPSGLCSVGKRSEYGDDESSADYEMMVELSNTNTLLGTGQTSSVNSCVSGMQRSKASTNGTAAHAAASPAGMDLLLTSSIEVVDGLFRGERVTRNDEVSRTSQHTRNSVLFESLGSTRTGVQSAKDLRSDMQNATISLPPLARSGRANTAVSVDKSLTVESRVESEYGDGGYDFCSSVVKPFGTDLKSDAIFCRGTLDPFAQPNTNCLTVGDSKSCNDNTTCFPPVGSSRQQNSWRRRSGARETSTDAHNSATQRGCSHIDGYTDGVSVRQDQQRKGLNSLAPISSEMTHKCEDGHKWVVVDSSDPRKWQLTQ
ncbi:hypothetical protein ERJ75_001040400 [Trypanosoma vivax]|uniref:Uncharacterized protein n=1 Tax=Trypanosoma vivax (strain Y486) TaxID=1055687 RepID=G0TZR4_TRYVY|nr:hypothetical protein TRVL_01253 [Trypanosoma vivax]KAH8610749.1 hypothetical protein ERJ75_001040400 [Trypanosoma vivax]CCC50092.1 conserved hypothetical protein [Trypanosoma vivax Y486]